VAAPADFSAALRAQSRALLPPEGTVLVVCVSGGADSVALLRLLHALAAWRLVVFHLDHGLRAESAQDAAWVAALCGSLGIECRIECVELHALARERRQGLEQAGREERYRRVAALAGLLQAQGILTAHHRDDQLETILMHVLRGAGANGARGVPARRDCDGIPVFRPLLHVTRLELRDYLASLGQDWREDSTNRDVALRRNAVRHRVLPQLEAAEPGFSQALLAWSQAQAQALEDQAGGVAYRQLRSHALEPSRQRVRRLQELAAGAPGRALHLGRWLVTRNGLGLEWRDLGALASAALPTVWITGPGSAWRGASSLLLRQEPPPDPAALRTRPGEAWLDRAAVSFPWAWRTVEPADCWQPLGSPGRQRVFKTFSDRKLPRAERAQVAVLSDAQGIIWIPGQGISERVRVRAQTATVLHGWSLCASAARG